ncbi:hypothetical protein JT359_15220 [Candidatus Poribacteria bacterium]|nr:hypothetical protein [Candidatus Poribacteria bacterium]
MKHLTFKRISYITIFVFLICGISTLGVAQVQSLKIEISDVISHADEIKLRHLLSPWVDGKDIKFSTPVDKNGRKRYFTTVVELKPRQGVSQYSESHTFDIYDIMRQLQDSRYRGRHGVGQVRLLRTDATVRGNMFAYHGFTRSSIQTIPAWARWRPHTSEIHHALHIGDGQDMVFKQTPEFDQLRLDAGGNNKEVEIEGKIVGFDGVYPIMSIKKYNFGYRVNQKKTQNQTPTNASSEGEKPQQEQQQPKYDYIENR